MATSVDTLLGSGVQPFSSTNIFKGKRVLVAVAPMTVAVPTAMTTGGTGTGGSAVPITLTDLTGYKSVGLLREDDGVAMSRDRNQSDIRAAGFPDPVRSDFTSDTFSAKIVALETNRTTIEKFLNVDLSAVVPNANTGEVIFPQPFDIGIAQNRWLFIAQDGIGVNRRWWGRIFTAGIVSDVDDQNLFSTDDGWYWPMTIQSQTDTALGYGIVNFWGGPGWKTNLPTMGWS